MAKEKYEILKLEIGKDNKSSEQKPSQKPIPTSYLIEALREKEQSLFPNDDDFIFNFDESDVPTETPPKVKATNETKKRLEPTPSDESLTAQRKGVPIPTARKHIFIDHYPSSLPRTTHIAQPFNDANEIELGSSPYQPRKNFISM